MSEIELLQFGPGGNLFDIVIEYLLADFEVIVFLKLLPHSAPLQRIMSKYRKVDSDPTNYVRIGIEKAASHGWTEGLSTLIDWDYIVEHKTDSDFLSTSLSIVAHQGHCHLLPYLVFRGAKDPHGEALKCAATRGCIPAMEFLFGNLGYKPRHLRKIMFPVGISGYIPAIKFVMKKATRFGMSPSIFMIDIANGAIVKRSLTVLQFILDQVETKINAIISSVVSYGFVAAMDLLLDHGVDPNKILRLAARHNSVPMMRAAIERKATYLNDALMSAACAGSCAAIEFAISSGATNLDAVANMAHAVGHRDAGELIHDLAATTGQS